MASSMRAFPIRSGCATPSVSAISGLLVSSCKVDPPPQPIFQFPIFSAPLANPPSFDFGCYAPSVSVETLTNQVTPFLNASVGFPQSAETGQCQPEFMFKIGFPAANCPDISGSASVTLLPPNTSPSASLKITKSTNCSFKFDLSLGIPGSGCVDVSTINLPAGAAIPLAPGGIFDTIDDAFLTSDTNSDGCTLLTLTTQLTAFQLPGVAGINVVPHGPDATPACCSSFNVVTSISSTTPGQIDYHFTTIQLPTVTVLTPVTLSSDNIACGHTVLALQGLSTNATSDCPCGIQITPILVEFGFTLPDVNNPVVTTAVALSLLWKCDVRLMAGVRLTPSHSCLVTVLITWCTRPIRLSFHKQW